MSIRQPTTLLLALACTTGCVTKKDYDALAAELAGVRDELSQSKTQVQDLETALRDTQTEVESLSAQISELEQVLAQTQDALALAEARASDAETQLAEVLKDRSKLAASVEDMQQALAELKRQRMQAEARAAVYRSLLNKFKSLIDNGKLKVKIVDGRMVLQLQTDILFGSGSAKLSDEGAATIREVGKLLSEIPDRRFQVEGHTDNVPINTKTYPSNWELASARAINVVKEMVEAGLPGSSVSAAAFAETRPTASNDTDDGRAQNRRIEIVIVPDLSDLPGAEDLEKLFKSASSS